MLSVYRPKERSRQDPSRPRRPGRRPSFEALEPRIALSALIPQVTALSATTTDSQSVTFTYAIANGALTSPLAFGIYRAPANQFDPSADALIGTDTVSGPDLAIGNHTVTVPISGGLPIDPADPYVLVVANPTGSVPPPSVASTGDSTASFRTFVIGAIAHGFEPTSGLPPWVPAMAQGLMKDGYNVAIPFDWSSVSRLPVPGTAVQAGQQLAGDIAGAVAQLQPQMHPGDVVDLHLIGHSRGAVVISQAALDLQAMEQAGALPQLRAGYLKMTFLGPHPAANIPTTPGHYQAWFSASPGPIGRVEAFALFKFQAAAQDPPVVAPSNADDVEVYYQHATYSSAPDLLEKFFNIWDQVPITNDSPFPVHYSDLTGIVNGHFEEQYWYLQNVVPTLGTAGPFISPGSQAPPSSSLAGSFDPRQLLQRSSRPALAYEANLLYPAVVSRRFVAVAALNQLSIAEAQLGRGQTAAALHRLTSLGRFIASQRGRTISPQVFDTLASAVQPLVSTLFSSLPTGPASRPVQVR